MKITFLGTSHGNPTLTRMQSASLIETQGRFYLVDAGDGVTASLIRAGISPDQLSAIFITHMHSDHTGGLPVLLEQAIKYRMDLPAVDLAVRLPDPKAEPALRSWLQINSVKDSILTDVKPYQAEKFFDDGRIQIEAFPTQHMAWSHQNPSLKSYSFRVTAERKTVQFTGDLTGDFSDFPFDAANGCDLLISELVHFSPESAYERLKNIQIGHLVFNHLGNRWQTPEGGQYVRRLFQSAPYAVTVAFDGLQIVV